MKISVLVLPVEGQRFEARAGEPFNATAEGNTRDEAVQKLQHQIAACIDAGAEVRQLELPDYENPWRAVVGMYRNDPLFDDWQKAIADRRREIDADPDAP